MAAATDYLLTDDLDLKITAGDFEKGASDKQASVMMLNHNTGALKLHPFCGMGIKKYVGSSGTELKMKREIRVQHEADGLKIEQLVVKDFNFYINFKREGYDD